MVLTGPGRTALLNEWLALVGDHGQLGLLPREHAALEIDGVKSLFEQKLGRATGTASRTADADDQLVSGNVVESVGYVREANVDRVGTSAVGILLILAYVEQKSPVVYEGTCFVNRNHDSLSIETTRSVATA
jgi:hypothetical protein